MSREREFLVQLTKRRQQQGNDDVPLLSKPAAYGPGQRQERSDEGSMRSCRIAFRRAASVLKVGCTGGRTRTNDRPLLFMVMQALATAPVRSSPVFAKPGQVFFAPFLQVLLNQNVLLFGGDGLAFEVVQPWVARWKASAISGAVNGAVLS